MEITNRTGIETTPLTEVSFLSIDTWKINRTTLIKIWYNLLFAHSMMSHLSCRVGMGGIRELLDGKIWEWDLSFRWQLECNGNGNEVIEMGGNWYEFPAHLSARWSSSRKWRETSRTFVCTRGPRQRLDYYANLMTMMMSFQWSRQDFVTGGGEVWVYRGSRVRSPPEADTFTAVHGEFVGFGTIWF